MHSELALGRDTGHPAPTTFPCGLAAESRAEI